MSIVYLGKRPANTYGNRAKRVRADPAPVYLGTRASAPRVAPVVAVPRSIRYPAPSDWWVLRCLCSFSYGEESRRHCCRQLQRQLHWIGHLDQW